MTVGILTFHAQLNYGGVLQAWALQESVRALGYPCVVVDRRLSDDNDALVHYAPPGLRNRAKLAFRRLAGLGDVAPAKRSLRTQAFLSSRLSLTPYHFVSWRSLPPSARLPDVLLVGSDQVWHAGRFGDPRAYLLRHAPPVRAVAYAASFGFAPSSLDGLLSARDLRQWDGRALPLDPGETVGMLYRQGLARFDAISCREAEGVDICRRLGFEATHVVDPSLLADPRVYGRIRAGRADGPCRRVFVYLLGEDFEKHRAALDAFARARKGRVDVFLNAVPPGWFGPLPSSPSRLRAWIAAFRRRRSLTRGRVRVRADAGPLEFLRALAAADAVVTDSFHAVMFSIVFERNVRVLRPSSPMRRGMFARIEEFAAHARGTFVVDGVDAAFDSLARGERVAFDRAWLDGRIAASRAWLAGRLAAAKGD